MHNEVLRIYALLVCTAWHASASSYFILDVAVAGWASVARASLLISACVDDCDGDFGLRRHCSYRYRGGRPRILYRLGR